MCPTLRFTYEDYLQLPENCRYEIVDGDPFMVPAPTPNHQRVSRKLGRFLDDYVTERNLGYISNERMSIIKEKNIQGTPDLVVEIVCAGTAFRDRGIKQKLYARAGVKEYWIVDPEARTIDVMALGPHGYLLVGVYRKEETLQSPPLPGLAIPLGRIF
ncbi:MAG: Uma2 family endonuclease [Acidobacteria bacterium]|nr:MAG: Uma2 family endonuclease [Acidobacteriota bacterium]